MTPLPALTFLFGHACWLVCLALGVRQLFVRPRWYGLVTIGIGVLQFLAVPLAMWLVMRAQGIEWGS
ncbi:hypothetical protein [Limnoglobus roseus]|uniref:Uncharacterized protein n=1 Tax=Limnoglobus roseus TaxID=2598579 RepID=A0A5C1AKZ6_9BACT|nr:hypothetical protein [Limnoglobus roseus]QEL18636.1 hypothetical protein PX52LOC_05669 [Limnoglobus roseus]